MAGTIKGLTGFTHNVQKDVFTDNVATTLSNMIISNTSSTLDIYVTLVIQPKAGVQTKPLPGVKIPPNVSLQLFETPVKLRSRGSGSDFRCTISYHEPTASTNNLMTVLYTAS